MNIALIQSSLIWENPDANRKYFENKINSISAEVNLIALPEMFDWFYMNPTAVAETMKGKTVQWMQNIGKSQKTQQ
jgi:predicted amidohydrolase